MQSSISIIPFKTNNKNYHLLKREVLMWRLQHKHLPLSWSVIAQILFTSVVALLHKCSTNHCIPQLRNSHRCHEKDVRKLERTWPSSTKLKWPLQAWRSLEARAVMVMKGKITKKIINLLYLRQFNFKYFNLINLVLILLMVCQSSHSG